MKFGVFVSEFTVARVEVHGSRVQDFPVQGSGILEFRVFGVRAFSEFSVLRFTVQGRGMLGASPKGGGEGVRYRVLSPL